MGQASGTAAALALRSSAKSRDVSVPQLQELLLEQHVWLGEDFTVQAVGEAEQGK
ncbi:hypothetical protein D3C78_1924680 [compost metagenome]